MPHWFSLVGPHESFGKGFLCCAAWLMGWLPSFYQLYTLKQVGTNPYVSKKKVEWLPRNFFRLEIFLKNSVKDGGTSAWPLHAYLLVDSRCEDWCDGCGGCICRGHRLWVTKAVRLWILSVRVCSCACLGLIKAFCSETIVFPALFGAVEFWQLWPKIVIYVYFLRGVGPVAQQRNSVFIFTLTWNFDKKCSNLLRKSEVGVVKF